jgi:hypothetical protein
MPTLKSRPQADRDRQLGRSHSGRSHPYREDQWVVSVRGQSSPDEYLGALKLAIERAWLWLQESGTYVRFTQTGADLFA